MTWIKPTTTQGGGVFQAADVGALTDNSTGTADLGIQAAGTSFNGAGENNDRADHASAANTLRANARTAGLMA